MRSSRKSSNSPSDTQTKLNGAILFYLKGVQWCKKHHFRRPKGFGSYLILLIACLFFSYVQNGIYKLLKLEGPNLGKLEQWQSAVIVAIVTESCPNLLFPFAGWLADAKFGRRNVLSAGMFITWMSALVLHLVSVLHNSLEWFKDSTILALIIVIYVASAIGTAFFYANLLPFGIDQMEDCSSDQISSFIHWYYLISNVNLGGILQLIFSFLPSEHDKSKYDDWISLGQIILLTIGVCLLFIFSKNFMTDPLVYSPLRVVRVITQYIMKHNKPVRYRSAHTYVSEVKPLRSDFAKKSYGGCFEDDVVEEVVTFWRIMVFLVPIGIFCTIYYIAYYTSILIHFEISEENFVLIVSALTNMIPNFTNLVCILMYEFVVCPFFRKYIPRLAVKIGLGMLSLLAAVGYLLAVDTSAHYVANMYYSRKGYNVSSYQLCFLFAQSFSTYILMPFTVLVTISKLLIFVTTLEFICAQSPRSMRSFLMSIVFFVYGISAILMSIFILPFGFGFKAALKHLTYSCGSVFFASVIGFGIVGFILYFYIAKWYKGRQRGGQNNINYQFVIEGYYEKMIEERDRQEKLQLSNS